MSGEKEQPDGTVNVQIDGRWIRVPPGTRAIDACARAGVTIPHFCYHPALSSPGSCRMCQVEMGEPRRDAHGRVVRGPDGFPEIRWLDRPQITCAREVSEGMAIRTGSELARAARRSAMEFLLINHPLDCPICDQAGECRLQEYSVDYGPARSRFLEDKEKKPKRIAVGPRVILDDERCILCSRCTRFLREIAREGTLGFVGRGARTRLAAHPDRPLASNYSLNTVDLCPVGALTSTDFRFRMRLWFLRETPTIDVNCGTGCNITVASRENRIYRVTPRENPAVNGFWMPDSHRLAFASLHDPARLLRPETRAPGAPARAPVPWPEAIAAAAARLRAIDGARLALLASARMTNEEMFLARALARALGIGHVEILPRWDAPDGILISADRNPNTAGARLLGLTGPEPGAHLPALTEAVMSGRVRGLVALGENPLDAGIRPGSLDGLDAFVSVALLPDPSTPYATTLLPGAGWAEKRGSMINVRGRIQRLNRAIDPPGEARDDWEILRDLLVALGETGVPGTLDALFARMAAEIPALAGLTLERIGDLGVPVLDAGTPGAAAPPGSTADHRG